MKYLGKYSISRSVLALLTLGILSVGIFSLATMSHDSMAESKNCPISMNEKDCTQSDASAACVNYHLGVLQELSTAIPQSLQSSLLGLMFVSVLALVIFGFADKTFRIYCRLKVRLRQLLIDTITVFQNQLGFWLSIIQKRDPSYAFANA